MPEELEQPQVPNEQTEPDKQTPAAETLQKTLREQQEKLDKYEQLFQNPTMQKVIDKISKGEEISFEEQKQMETEKQQVSMKDQFGIKEKPEDIDLDSLGNKELLGIVSDTVEDYVSKVREESSQEYKTQIEEMKKDLLKTQDALLNMSAQSQVEALQSKYPDFDKYRDDMQKLAEKYPQMAIEDLYEYAKGRHRLSVPGAESTETEKPESSSPFPEWSPVHLRKPDGEKEKSGGPSTTPLRSARSGRQDFSNMVNQAAQSLLSKQKMGG